MDATPQLELVLIRHGQSQFNLDGNGGTDSPLTALGIEQAKRLGPWLAKRFEIDVLYSSTMVRARQTAELIAPHVNQPIQFDDDLRESDFDIAEVMPHFANPARAIGGVPNLIDQMPACYIDFEARVVSVFRKIVGAHDSGMIAIVTHGGVIATIIRTIFGAHQVSVYAENTSVLLLRWMNDRWYLVFSNCMEHLRP